MKLTEKLAILADAAKYDASCASSGSRRKNTRGGIGNAAESGICHSWSADGRCISLLKILMSNDCLYDCVYCLSRRSGNVRRATFTPSEVVELTINFYLRNYIEGLFLSSAVYASPEQTMTDMVAVCELLRKKHKFNGYIHLKIIPGAPADLVQLAGFLVDRMSVNIELPSEASLKKLAPQKTKKGIMLPMRQIGDNVSGYTQERKKSRKAPRFCPGGQSTQMIIGASDESDHQILTLGSALYSKMQLRRVYYSAYVPVNRESSLLPATLSSPPLLREHRLYQADWLLRMYQFQVDELFAGQQLNLDEKLDPKAAWALRNFDLFPLDICRASYDELLRVPGIGPRSAARIISTRRVTAIRKEDLTKMGLVMKRAKYFISIGGRSLATTVPHHLLMAALRSTEKGASARGYRQLRLF